MFYLNHKGEMLPIKVLYSRCPRCGKFFVVDPDDIFQDYLEGDFLESECHCEKCSRKLANGEA